MNEKIRTIIDSIIKLDENIGFKRVVRYTILILIVIGIFNFKAILTGIIEMCNEVSEQIHSEKMELRDELLTELRPTLAAFRTDVKADRLLYFEYHNSNENLVSIPFKYVELVLSSTGYGIAPVSDTRYNDFNAGSISCLYDDIKDGRIIYCSGAADEEFLRTYPGVFELFNGRDQSHRQIYISVPGIRQPIGLIVLEWMDDEDTGPEVNIREVFEKIQKGNYMTAINGLILSKTR